MNPEDLSKEELLRVLARDRNTKEQLASRLAMLTLENIELVGVIQEQQTEMQKLRGDVASSNGETVRPMPPVDVPS